MREWWSPTPGMAWVVEDLVASGPLHSICVESLLKSLQWSVRFTVPPAMTIWLASVFQCRKIYPLVFPLARQMLPACEERMMLALDGHEVSSSTKAKYCEEKNPTCVMLHCRQALVSRVISSWPSPFVWSIMRMLTSCYYHFLASILIITLKSSTKTWKQVTLHSFNIFSFLLWPWFPIYTSMSIFTELKCSWVHLISFLWVLAMY